MMEQANPFGNQKYTVPQQIQTDRTKQVAFLEDRMRSGNQPLAVTGLAAILIQVETHTSNAHHFITIRVGH